MFVVRDSDRGALKAPDYTGKAVIYWDLDNKMPPRGVGVRATIESVRSFLLQNCRSVEAVKIYANTATLSCVRGKLRGGGDSQALPDASDYDDSEPPEACPVCGRVLKGNVWRRRRSLQRHLDMHRGEFKKRQIMRACLGSSMRRNQKVSFGFKNERYIEGRNAILSLLDGMDGVELRARQKEAVRQIKGFDATTMMPVPTSPQAADQEIIHDLRLLLHRCSGAGTICLISDDGGFVRSLQLARQSGWRVVTIADRDVMLRVSDVGLPWEQVTTHAGEMAKSSPNASPDVFFKSPYGRQDQPQM